MPRRPRRVSQTVIDIRHAPLKSRDWILVVVVTVVVIAAAFAGRAALFASFDASDPNYLVRRIEFGRYRETDDIFSSYTRALALQHSTVDVVIFGSSAAREALPRGRDLELQLSAVSGRQIRIADLTSSGQAPGEILILLDTMRIKSATTVILVLSPTRLFKQLKATATVIPSDFPLDHLTLVNDLEVEAPATEVAVPVAQRCVATLNALRLILYRWFRVGPENYFRQHVYGITPPARDPYLYKDLLYGNVVKRAGHHRNVTASMVLASAGDVQLNVDLILALARRIRATGGRLIVIDAPMVAGKDAAFYGADRWHTYRALVARLRQEMAAVVIDVNATAALTAVDFFDSTHVGESGRQKWSNAFIDAVGARLKSEDGP